ncbi:MAG: hypothetical protein ABIJ08_05895, partial [Nanoarchaeota archaeon]
NHKNNILFLSGTPDNFKKFISAKIDIFFFNKCTFFDFINGSKIKNICLSYKGNEMGSSILNLEVFESLVFDGKHYNKIVIPYYKEYDTKLRNKPILKNVGQNVEKASLISCKKELIKKNVEVKENGN